MAISRTAKGTNSSKASGTTLAVNSVSINAGALLIVGIAWEDEGQTDKPELTYGNKVMKYVAGSEAQRGDTVVRLYRFRVKKNRTANVTATWANAKTAKAMFVTEVKEASVKDVQQTNTQPENTAKNTGTAVTTTGADTIAIAAFAMIGPGNDTDPTAGAGHTIGQIAGTNGAPPVSNIKLVETYEILSATGDCRSEITLTTARASAATIVALEPVQTYTVGRATYLPYDGNPESEAIAFAIEDETGNALFTVNLPRREFEQMTDTEVEDYIRQQCQWRADKDYDGAPSPDFTPDATFNTRVASFVNDTFTV